MQNQAADNLVPTQHQDSAKLLQSQYQVIRDEYGKTVALMQCDFEDIEYFKSIAQNPQNKILRNGKDITDKYKTKSKNCINPKVEGGA
jgi:hypothetical protein